MAARHASKSSGSKKPLLVAAVMVAALIVGAGVLVGISTSHQSAAVAHGPAKEPSFAILAATPSNTATVDSTASIRIALSQPLSSASPLPVITPSVPGSWQLLSPTTLEYVQAAPFAPGQSVTVSIPGGPSGLKSSSGKLLSTTVTSSFKVAPLSILRVQQLLAQLGYLPVTFTPSSPANSSVSTADLPGTFSLRWSSLPTTLSSQWQPGVDNVVTKAAIMRFEDVHGMSTDGQPGPSVWTQLLADAAQGKVDPDPYTYVYVNQSLPQTLQLYSNGQKVFNALVNTGIAVAKTDSGTFPVYLRYKVTTMAGTNPDGTTYNDPDIPWVSYFNGGDGLHGFIRPSYGSPQSLGCVEMTFADAAAVWPQTPIGTLVTVS
jgi:peptidoglycan hydrolase-like protein with peptidoglycan-binding domain